MSFARKFVACAAVAFSTISLAAAADRWMEIPEPPAMLEAAESGAAPVNGIEMYYAVYGSGDPGFHRREVNFDWERWRLRP